ncbi:MAG: hypothetical protein NVS9B1_05520 [Candidatus Dormibacteraceae bacterium]
MADPVTIGCRNSPGVAEVDGDPVEAGRGGGMGELPGPAGEQQKTGQGEGEPPGQVPGSSGKTSAESRTLARGLTV